MTEPRLTIDLPDDFGLDDDNRADLRVAVWIAGALLLTLTIAAMLVIGAFA